MHTDNLWVGWFICLDINKPIFAMLSAFRFISAIVALLLQTQIKSKIFYKEKELSYCSRYEALRSWSSSNIASVRAFSIYFLFLYWIESYEGHHGYNKYHYKVRHTFIVLRFYAVHISSHPVCSVHNKNENNWHCCNFAISQESILLLWLRTWKGCEMAILRFLLNGGTP